MRILKQLLPWSIVLFTGCAVEQSTHGEVASAVGPALPAPPPPPPPPPCTPAPPIDPLMCNPEEPAPPPPPIAGKCDIEIRVEAVGFFEGQGWVEDRAEAAAFFTATDLDTGDAVDGRFPVNDTVKMEVGTEHVTNIGLGTYTVEEGETKDVRVCATFTESDWPDADDVGVKCRTFELECPQPGVESTISEDLCKGGDCSKLRGRMTADIHILTLDADRDCVENVKDYTPEPCDEAFKGQLCRASLLHFNYGGDGFLNDLAQNLGTDLVPAMTGYDRVILLIDDDQVGPFNLNPAALALADVVMKPSEANFFAALQDLTADGCDIDTWIYSHGTPDWDSVWPNPVVFSGGGSITAFDDDEHQADPDRDPDITTDELLEDTDPGNSGTLSVPIRMTYGTACFYEEWNQAWLDVGAKVTGGTRDLNFIPNRYERFATSWVANNTYGFSLSNEATAANEALAFAFIAGQGLPPPWLCVGNGILGSNACAFNFFNESDHQPLVNEDGQWTTDGPDKAQYSIGGPLWDLAGITYDDTVSGAANMRRSSVKIRVGNPAIRKGSVGLVWP